jgi:oligosaccharide repeat unit polymerase
MIYYISRIYIAAIFIYFANPIEYALPYLLSVQISPVLFLIGLMIINYMTKFQRSEIKYYYRNPILSPLRSFGIRIIIATGIILLVALIPIYIRQVKNIALFHLIAGDSTAAELMVMREEVFKQSNSPITLLFGYARNFIYPFMIILCLFMAHTTRKFQDKLYFFAYLLTGLFFASLATAKAPVARILLLVAFGVYIVKKGRISLKQGLIMIAIIISFPFAVYLFLNRSAGFSLDRIFSVFFLIGRRLFYVPSSSVYYYFELFPKHHDFLYGSSNGKIAWLLGSEYVNVANLVFNYVTGGSWITTGYVNAAFIANFYADFGIPGVLFISFYVGILIGFIQIMIIRGEKTVSNVTIQCMLLANILYLVSTSFYTSILSGGIISYFFVKWIIKYISNFINEIFNLKKARL